MSKVIEAAEEFVEKMTETEDAEQEGSAEPESGSEPQSTMDARKAKMEELRRKMVSPTHTEPLYYVTDMSYRRGPLH